MVSAVTAGPTRHRIRRPTRFLVLAAIWGGGLLIAATTVPVYSESSNEYRASSPTVVRTESSRTLVGQNGSGALAVMAVPLALVGVVAGALELRRRRGRTGPGAVATMTVVLAAALSVLAMLTVGIFVLPLVVLLAVACGSA